MSDEWSVTLRAPADAELSFAGESRTITVHEEETILGAARAAGIWLPADCQQGWCTTCAAIIVSGEVDQSTARRYYQEDREANFILPCTAKPRSDLVVRVGAYEEFLAFRAACDRPPGRSKLGEH